MIREAIEADIPRLVDMGIGFLRLYYADKLPENREQMKKTVTELMGNPNGHVLVAENGHGIEGMFVFVVFPHFFSGELIAGELVWWIEPEARGRSGLALLREAESISRKMGAKKMQAGAPSERTATLYKRLGFQEVETTYQRSL